MSEGVSGDSLLWRYDEFEPGSARAYICVVDLPRVPCNLQTQSTTRERDRPDRRDTAELVVVSWITAMTSTQNLKMASANR